MGLGRWPDVPIAEARERAAQARRALRDGIDPIIERQKQRQSLHRMTLHEAIDACFVARQAELKGDGKAGRWMSPLNTHIIPKIGKHPVEQIDQHILKQVLQPLWHTKADTARKALNRISLSLKHAAACGLDVDLQAPMKVRALLGKQRHEPKHIEAMPYLDTPAFYAELSKRDGMAALALRFLILTGVRSAGVLYMTTDEIEGDVWIIPAGRSKTNQEHRVPLSLEALRVINSAKTDSSPFVFANKNSEPLSNMAMSKLMKDAGYTARPHGFRATLRTWMEEQTDASFEAKETALAHQVGSKVTQAYQRSDHLDKRKILMDEWACFVRNN
jgi:integrase